MRRSFSKTLVLPLLALCAGAMIGCASTQSAQEKAAARASVVGTWKYEVEGIAPLDEGTFQITEKDDRLRARLKDRRRGRLRARVDVHDSRLELTVDDLRISGYVEDDTFTAFLRRQKWSVTTRQQRRSRSRSQSASLYARRVQSATSVDEPSVLDCQSILWEADGCT